MSNEAKCDCQQCGEHIAFPREADGQTIECPHCKRETLLSMPPAETNQRVNCPCQHCRGAIEFEARALVEENSLVQCPHCGLETKLFIPQDTLADIAANLENDSGTHPPAEGNEGIDNARLKRLEEIADRMVICHKEDTLTISGDTVTIQKRGWANALASGMNGDRTIQVSSLTAVQMKPAGKITVGYILFSYAGSKPFMGGIWEATQDPDAFLFTNDLNGQVAEFKAKVERKMRESKHPAPANHPTVLLTDELRKLAEFRQQGILSQAEFEAAKKKLLT
jgi:hypothetical protein